MPTLGFRYLSTFADYILQWIPSNSEITMAAETQPVKHLQELLSLPSLLWVAYFCPSLKALSNSCLLQCVTKVTKFAVLQDQKGNSNKFPSTRGFAENTLPAALPSAMEGLKLNANDLPLPIV